MAGRRSTIVADTSFAFNRDALKLLLLLLLFPVVVLYLDDVVADFVDSLLSLADESYLLADAVTTVDFFNELDVSLILSSLAAPSVVYLLVRLGVADDVDVFASRLIALRYVPPEYDGRYDDGDDIEPKRGDLLSDSENGTSSRDEY